jgi:hypothetical protein
MKHFFVLGLLVLFGSVGELPSEACLPLSAGQITAIILGLGLVVLGSLPEIKRKR